MYSKISKTVLKNAGMYQEHTLKVNVPNVTGAVELLVERALSLADSLGTKKDKESKTIILKALRMKFNKRMLEIEQE